MTLTMVVSLGVAMLLVDVGRTRLVKAELQDAADAAARYGATGLETSVATARSRAATAAAANKANGASVTLVTATDVEFGVWNPTTENFQLLTGSSEAGATAIRVTARCVASRNTSVPNMIASLLRYGSRDVTATSIASRGKVIAANVDADSCPWLAGMPNNTIVAGYDENTTDAKAPAQSPVKVSGLPLTAGTKLSFRQCAGMTSYEDGNQGDFGPDGNTGRIVRQRPVNGINATSAPLNCLVGIFLDARTPSTYGQSIELDFSSSTSRNFQTLSPGLKQVFFIGDGLDDAGRLQQFIIPTGATRFYLGIMDEKGWWWDNTGLLQTTFLDGTVTTVK